MAEQQLVADREPIAGVLPVALGAESKVRIPVPGTNGLAIELSPRGWTPKAGTTSSLFVQDLTGKRHLRLDFGFNKASQLFEWHWNQKGTYPNFGIPNHASVGRGEQILGKVAKIYRIAGRALLVVAVAADVCSIVKASQPLKRSVQVVTGWAGAGAGCKVVGAGGAYIGTALAPGVGTAVGGFLGCAAGAFVGYLSGVRASGYLYEWTAGTTFTQSSSEVVPAGGSGGAFGGAGASGSW